MSMHEDDDCTHLPVTVLKINVFLPPFCHFPQTPSCNPLAVSITVPLFSTVVPSSIFMFLSCRPIVVITTLSTGLVGVEITSASWLGQLTVGV